MKSLGALGTHYQQSVTTRADLGLITRGDGVQFGFSTLPSDQYYDGVLYRVVLGYLPSAIAESSDLAVDNLDFIFVPDATYITEADLLAGKWDGAAIEFRRINYADLSMAHEVLKKGSIGQIAFHDGRYVGEFRSQTQRLQTAIGRTVQKDCDDDFGGPRCKKDVAALTVTGTITAVLSQLVMTDSARAEAAAFFDLGQIIFTTGLNTGFQREIKTHATGGVFTLQEGMPYLPVVGDAYSLFPGCNKTPAQCKLYGNYVNFQGFPDLPGLDELMSPTNG